MDFLLPTIIGGGGGIKFDGEMLGDDFTDTDKQFAAVLLQLPRLIFESDSLFIWGAGNKKKRTTRRRRRRECGDNTKKDPVNSDISAATPTGDEPTTSKQWPEGFSPDTPLISSFSPARTDPKPLTKPKAVKKRREDYILLINQLEEERDTLKRQIEDFERKMNVEMVANALLKRQREELIVAQECERIAKLVKVNTDLTLGRQWSPPPPPAPPSTALSSSSSTALSASYFQSRGGLGAWTDQYQPLILNRTDIVADNGISFSMQLKVNVGPSRLPDLNDTADVCHVSSNPQPLDVNLDKKAMATLARQRRRHIQKFKPPKRI